jgi:hypothetical protein
MLRGAYKAYNMSFYRCLVAGIASAAHFTDRKTE